MCWHSFQHMSFFIPHASHLRMRMCAGVPPDTPWAGAGSKEEAAWLLPNKEGRKTEGSAWNLKLGREIDPPLGLPESTSLAEALISVPKDVPATRRARKQTHHDGVCSDDNVRGPQVLLQEIQTQL